MQVNKTRIFFIFKETACCFYHPLVPWAFGPLVLRSFDIPNRKKCVIPGWVLKSSLELIDDDFTQAFGEVLGNEMVATLDYLQPCMYDGIGYHLGM